MMQEAPVCQKAKEIFPRAVSGAYRGWFFPEINPPGSPTNSPIHGGLSGVLENGIFLFIIDRIELSSHYISY